MANINQFSSAIIARAESLWGLVVADINRLIDSRNNSRSASFFDIFSQNDGNGNYQYLRFAQYCIEYGFPAIELYVSVCYECAQSNATYITGAVPKVYVALKPDIDADLSVVLTRESAIAVLNGARAVFVEAFLSAYSYAVNQTSTPPTPTSSPRPPSQSNEFLAFWAVDGEVVTRPDMVQWNDAVFAKEGELGALPPVSISAPTTPIPSPGPTIPRNWDIFRDYNTEPVQNGPKALLDLDGVIVTTNVFINNIHKDLVRSDVRRLLVDFGVADTTQFMSLFAIEWNQWKPWAIDDIVNSGALPGWKIWTDNSLDLADWVDYGIVDLWTIALDETQKLLDHSAYTAFFGLFECVDGVSWSLPSELEETAATDFVAAYNTIATTFDTDPTYAGLAAVTKTFVPRFEFNGSTELEGDTVEDWKYNRVEFFKVINRLTINDRKVFIAVKAAAVVSGSTLRAITAAEWNSFFELLNEYSPNVSGILLYGTADSSENAEIMQSSVDLLNARLSIQQSTYGN